MKPPNELFTGEMFACMIEGDIADGARYVFPGPDHPCVLHVIASWALGWDHVSVSIKDRCPTWDEMCYVKGLFFEPDECVLQYHPAEESYVNHHPFCLHLWKPQGVEFPIPPTNLVGPKEETP